MMVGREVLLRVDKPPATPGDVVLELEDVHVRDDRGIETGLAASRSRCAPARSSASQESTETARPSSSRRSPACNGARAAASSWTDARCRRTRARWRCSRRASGHIPEDRHRYGLILDFTLAENAALHDFRYPPDSRFGWLRPKVLVERTRRLIEEFDVRGGNPQTKARNLSGGNQQKLVAAREVDRDPRVLIAAQPTGGLDVGAIEYLHRRLVEERDVGRAVLLVSLELEEVLSLSDRILVMYEGQIVAEHASGVTEEEIGVEMLGGQREAVA